MKNSASIPHTSHEYIDIVKCEKIYLKEHYGVTNIGIFGSYARHQQTEFSDIDILVDLEEQYLTFDNYMDLRFYLEDKLGKKVDLGITSSIRKEFMKKIEQEAIYV